MVYRCLSFNKIRNLCQNIEQLQIKQLDSVDFSLFELYIYQDFTEEEMSVLIHVLGDLYLAADKFQVVTLEVPIGFISLSKNGSK